MLLLLLVRGHFNEQLDLPYKHDIKCGHLRLIGLDNEFFRRVNDLLCTLGQLAQKRRAEVLCEDADSVYGLNANVCLNFLAQSLREALQLSSRFQRLKRYLGLFSSVGLLVVQCTVAQFRVDLQAIKVRLKPRTFLLDLQTPMQPSLDESRQIVKQKAVHKQGTDSHDTEKDLFGISTAATATLLLLQ